MYIQKFVFNDKSTKNKPIQVYEFTSLKIIRAHKIFVFSVKNPFFFTNLTFRRSKYRIKCRLFEKLKWQLASYFFLSSLPDRKLLPQRFRIAFSCLITAVDSKQPVQQRYRSTNSKTRKHSTHACTRTNRFEGVIELDGEGVVPRYVHRGSRMRNPMLMNSFISVVDLLRNSVL